MLNELTPAAWRKIFEKRWGMQYQINNTTRLSSSISSYLFRLSFPTTIERGFMVQYRQNILQKFPNGKNTLRGCGTLWKAACVLRERGEEMFRCRICNELEPFSSQDRQFESLNAYAEHLCTMYVGIQSPCIRVIADMGDGPNHGF